MEIRRLMEIRRDPITQSWVVQGQKESHDGPAKMSLRPSRVGREADSRFSTRGRRAGPRLAASRSSVSHRRPAGQARRGHVRQNGPDRRARSRRRNAPARPPRLSQVSDEEIERVLSVWASRIADLKKRRALQICQRLQKSGRRSRRRMVSRALPGDRHHLCAAPH